MNLQEVRKVAEKMFKNNKVEYCESQKEYEGEQEAFQTLLNLAEKIEKISNSSLVVEEKDANHSSWESTPDYNSTMGCDEPAKIRHESLLRNDDWNASRQESILLLAKNYGLHLSLPPQASY